MEIVELLNHLGAGEDSGRQFKQTINSQDQLAAEMVAFSNTEGGHIFIGVDDSGAITGLNDDDIKRLNLMISNVASQNVRPAINPITENIITDQGIVIVLFVPKGLNKPYQDKGGIIWVKNGADKRKATAREELQRLFQSSGLIHADDSIIPSLSIADLDLEYFSQFFKKRYNESLDDQLIPLPQIIHNLNLGQDGRLNLSGALLFSKNPSAKLPAFIVKARAFNDLDISTTNYRDNLDITGKISDIFQQAVGFIIRNLHHIQGDKNFNSVGTPEISPDSINELVANALIHRDYFISTPIKIFVLPDRVEIISPGHLPNNLTVENIKYGNSNMRNPVLASFATHIIPYSGLGTGIIRALKHHPNIEFFDDRENNLFKVTLLRNKHG